MNRRSYEEDVCENETKKTKSREKQLLFMVPKILFVLVFIGIAYLAVSTSLRMQGKRGVNLNHNGKREEVATENPRNNGLIENLLSRTKPFKVDVGMRSDYRLQDCDGSHFKRTFPDIDYAFFGYNILKGYPLANGHDPGFTYPIFETDYTERRKSSDCRYRIPRGLVVVPDVSCITSFSSTTVQNKYELTKSLSQSAKVSVGVGIVAFSASAGYKESSSELSTGEFVKIISTAKCTYYFCKLDKVNHPYFTKSFISSVKKLDESTQDQIYLDFFHYYGTHFLNYTEFGARFTYEHTMDSKTFQKKEEAGHNVGVDASYSGEYNIGGGFNMESTHKQDASNFAKDVTTKTFTVGAPPPANGDALTWVSTVKQSPVPMSYKLSPISELFTEKYMKGLNVNYQKIAEKLDKLQSAYCLYLRDMGKVDSCKPLKPGLILSETTIAYKYKSMAAKSFKECIDLCEEETKCLASTFCVGCSPRVDRYHQCYMLTNDKREKKGIQIGPIVNRERWDTVIFNFKIPSLSTLAFTKTAVVGRSRGPNDYNTLEKCTEGCTGDAYCVAFTFCTCSTRRTKCKIYTEDGMSGLKADYESTTYFVPLSHKF